MLEYLIVFLVGLIFGSFLNVLIHRLPLEQSLFKPLRSVCPECQKSIKWYENIPIFSYIFLKRKCSNCNKPISLVYPVVELITAIVTLILYINYWLIFDFIVTLTLFYTLIVMSFIDLKYKAVPDYLLIISVVLVILIGDITNILLFAGGFVLLELIMTFYIQNIKAKVTKNKDLEKQRALGEGDIPIAGIIGGLLGLELGVSAICIAALIALLPALYNLALKKSIEIAFIPYLSLGLLITLIFEFNVFKIW